MSLLTPKHMFLADFVVGGITGLGMLILPSGLLSLLGVADTAPVDLLARMIGAGLVGTAYAQFAMRDEAAGAAIGLQRALFVYELLGGALLVYGIVSGTLRPFGWGLALAYLVFALGRAIVLFRPASR